MVYATIAFIVLLVVGHGLYDRASLRWYRTMAELMNRDLTRWRDRWQGEE